ncbi:hypothetical protein ACLOJK_040881 [Asimina triloba]
MATTNPPLFSPFLTKFPDHPRFPSLFSPKCPCKATTAAAARCFPVSVNAIYTEGRSVSGTTRMPPPPPLRKDRVEQETDAIAVLHERIRRDHGSRAEVLSARPAMDSGEAEMYIRKVKEQQQRGLLKLKGERAEGEGFGYRVDPYTLHQGDFVVHKKVGIGKFFGIKFDVPKGSTEPIEYAFIEYADGMAKLPVKQASRMLYRYSLPNEKKKPRTLSKLNDPGAWERRKTKGKLAIQKMVVDLMELYLHRLKQKRPPYPKCSAMSEFVAQFPFEPTPDQRQVQVFASMA